jgi:hypothetical protein
MSYLNEFGSLNELLALVDGLSIGVKAGWLLCLTWSLAQLVWYRRGPGHARVLNAATVPAPFATIDREATDRDVDLDRQPSPDDNSAEFLAALGIARSEK